MMKEQKREAICHAALRHFGAQNQALKTMEECGELIQALARKAALGLETHSPGPEVLEELADVAIMVYQMGLLYPDGALEGEIDQKICRLSMRIGIEMARDDAEKTELERG